MLLIDWLTDAPVLCKITDEEVYSSAEQGNTAAGTKHGSSSGRSRSLADGVTPSRPSLDQDPVRLFSAPRRDLETHATIPSTCSFRGGQATV